MLSRKTLLFLVVSVSAGLLAALLALWLTRGGTHPNNAASFSRLGIPEQGPVSYAAAVQRAAPAVVNIYSTKVTLERQSRWIDDPLLRRFFGDRLQLRPKKRLQTSLGSGVIIGRQGYIMTNNHVIEGAEQIRVVLASGKTLEARVIGADPDTDLALLKAPGGELPEIRAGNSDTLQVGDVVLAIGNPFGVGQTVTMGIVSATGRDQVGINTFENFIQTDAAINPGNSGGALINARGELVGINSAIYSRSGGSQGIGFAIPVTLAREVMRQIVTNGRVVRGWLGIAGQGITPELAESFGLPRAQGVLVTGVLDGGPADQAGIRPGDIISRIGNTQPATAHQILTLISSLPPGERVEIEIWRENRPLRIQAEIAERPTLQKRGS